MRIYRTKADEREIENLHPDSFGARLRIARHMRGVRIRELAKAAGTSPQAVSQMECGTLQCDHRLGTVVKFAEALRVDPAILAFGYRRVTCPRCEGWPELLPDDEREKVKGMRRRGRRVREARKA